MESKVEEYIKAYTRNCSNEIIVPTKDGNTWCKGYEPWLTPDHARAVAQIAREEVIEKAVNYLMELTHGDGYVVEDFEKVMREE